ncbi:MAG: hypothetical protein H7Y14_03375 [Burkholderiales bacterium]|nr:hypothetical protein [Burkholderiales bacterium]
MASDKDVLGKADALLRRGTAASETAGVPVLTDLVHDPKAKAATEELAREVFSRVMAEVEGRLAADLEKRLVQHLVPQVHTAVASALGDLHQELANAIGDAVAAALKDRQLK